MMSNTLETEESNINQENYNQEQSSQEKTIYNTNSLPNINTICFNPNPVIKSSEIKNEITDEFPKSFTRQAILNSLINQQKTISLQKKIMEANIETIEFVVNELKGAFSDIIKDKMAIIFAVIYLKNVKKNSELKFWKNYHQRCVSIV